MKKNLLSLLLALALSSGGSSAQNATDDFPNVLPGAALSILADGTASAAGRINYADDKDVFNFQVGNNGGVTIYTTGSTDTNGVLRRQSGTGWNTIVSEDSGAGNFRISRILDPGLYSIQVAGRLASAAGAIGGEYGLRVEIAPPTPPAPPDIDIPEVARGGTMAFGALALNTGVTKTVTVRNTGASTLQVTAITVTGASANTPAGGTAAPFFVEGGGARSVAPGASSTFKVIFRPATAGDFTGTVNVVSNDPDENPWTFVVTGTGSGTPPPPPAAPEIALALGQIDIASGGTVDFGTIPLASNGSIAVKELLISNIGEADLHLGAIKIQAPPANAAGVLPPSGEFFRVLTAPAATVAPGRNTVLRIGAGGTATAFPAGTRVTMEATIANDDADENPYRLVLTAAIATPPPPAPGEIAVFSGDAEIQDDGTLNLGTTPTGRPLERAVTIKNKGTGNLQITSIEVEASGLVIAVFPPPPLPFRVVGTEARIVAPGASTTCRVIFPATAAGPAEANLVIGSSDADENPFTILLTAAAEGDPVPPATAEIAVSLEDSDLPLGGTVDFGRTSVTVPVRKTITISNQGTGVLQVRGVIQPAGKAPANAAGDAANGGNLVALPFRFSGEPVTRVEPGASRPLIILFQPATNGTFQAALVIANNDSDENPYKVKLTGQGGTDPAALPDIALSLGDANLPQGGTVNFGEVAPGASVTKEIRISNTGAGDLRLGRISFQSATADGGGDPNNAAGTPGANGGVILPPVGALPFRALPPPDSVVPAGRSAILRVVYMAPPSGSSSAVLVIESNDPDESPYKLNLLGKSTGIVPVPPDISVKVGDAELPAGGTLHFGTVIVGAPVRREITLSNTGGGELRIFGFSILPAEFLANNGAVWMPPNALVRVVSGPGVIPSGGSGKYVLEMMGFAAGPAKLQARISSNDPDENPYSFAVTGEISDPPAGGDPAVAQ